MGRLADVPLLLRWTLLSLGTRTELTCLHVGAVAQLPLFVLEVGIVRRIGAGGKVIVRAYDVVIGRGYARVQPEVVLVWDTRAHAKTLCPHLRRIETCIDTEFTVCQRLLILHALVDLLFSVNAELSICSLVLVARHLRACRTLSRR